MPFELNGQSYEGMAYLMNYGEIAPPSQQYYNTILQGYRENGLDESYLQKASENSLQMDFAEEIDEDIDIDDFENVEIDIFSAAVDFELVKNSINEVEQFAKDYIDCEEKEYCRMLDELDKYL